MYGYIQRYLTISNNNWQYLTIHDINIDIFQIYQGLTTIVKVFLYQIGKHVYYFTWASSRGTCTPNMRPSVHHLLMKAPVWIKLFLTGLKKHPVVSVKSSDLV